MKLNNAYKADFNTLLQAAKNGHLVLLDCQDKATGQSIPTICALDYDGHEYTFIPLAKLFTGNPYDEMNPPNPDGGYHPE